MKKIFVILIGVLLISFNQSKAQSLDEIIEKHLEVIGQEKLADVKTYKVDASVSQMGMEMPMSMKMKRPDKFKIEIDLSGQKMIQAYDGTSGWMVMPGFGNGPQDMVGDQLEQARDQVNIDDAFYKYKEKGFKAELVGKEEKRGVEVFHIKLTSPGGTTQSYYIDTNDYYLILMESVINSQGMEVEVESIISDYQVTNGVAIARKIESKTSMGDIVILIKNIEFNVPIDDSVFARPKE